MSVRMAMNNRVLAVAKVEGQEADAAIAEARRLRDQYDLEDRVWKYAKQSFVPLAMLALMLVV